MEPCPVVDEDRLTTIWRLQAEQQRLFAAIDAMDAMGRARYVKDLMLGLHEEVGDLGKDANVLRLDGIGLAEPIQTNILEEGVDVLKYLVAVLQAYGVTAEQLMEAFRAKTRTVKERYESARVQLQDGTRLIITDLDGCLADIEPVIQVFTSGYDGDAAHDFSNIAAIERRKHEFYQSGRFGDLAPIPGACDALAALKRNGWTIGIITARPHNLYKRIFSDTTGWLRAHGFQYDFIRFAKDKAEAVQELSPARPVWFVEDRAKHCMEMIDIGVDCLLFDTPRNRTLEHSKVRRVRTWQDVLIACGVETP